LEKKKKTMKRGCEPGAAQHSWWGVERVALKKQLGVEKKEESTKTGGAGYLPHP